MKREDITSVFPNATEEQISGLLNINSRDIGKAKGDYDTVKTELETARGTIADLEKNKGMYFPECPEEMHFRGFWEGTEKAQRPDGHVSHR